jgi:hypothetical protein
MTSLPSTDIASAPSEIARPKLDQPMGIKTILIFFAIMALGLFFAAYSIHKDLTAAGTPVTSYLPFLLLGVALLIALGFEFVNGFHDTANAVATVIYTHSLAPPIAVVWSGCFQFPRRTVLNRRGRFWHRFLVAGRTDHAGWLRGGVAPLARGLRSCAGPCRARARAKAATGLGPRPA